MNYAARTHHLEPEGAYQVLARANQLEAAGKEIIHLEIGQPDYPTFENVAQAGIDAIPRRPYPLYTARRDAVSAGSDCRR